MTIAASSDGTLNRRAHHLPALWPPSYVCVPGREEGLQDRATLPRFTVEGEITVLLNLGGGRYSICLVHPSSAQCFQPLLNHPVDAVPEFTIEQRPPPLS